MGALFWLIGLVLLVVVLFLLALLKPVKSSQFTPKQHNQAPTLPKELQDLQNQLSRQLPEFSLIGKSGQQARLLVKRKDKHCATVILAKTAVLQKRQLNEMLILTTNGQTTQLNALTTAIREHFEQHF